MTEDWNGEVGMRNIGNAEGGNKGMAQGQGAGIENGVSESQPCLWGRSA